MIKERQLSHTGIVVILVGASLMLIWAFRNGLSKIPSELSFAQVIALLVMLLDGLAAFALFTGRYYYGGVIAIPLGFLILGRGFPLGIEILFPLAGLLNIIGGVLSLLAREVSARLQVR